MIGLIVAPMTFFLDVVRMVLALLELVLFSRMSVEFEGKIFSNYSRRVKWQQELQELELVCIMFWIDHFILSHSYSGYSS